eukprot:gene15975-22105_t
MNSSKASIREALTGSNDKSKVPPVADGILSVTPDSPEVVEWRSRSALDTAEISSTYLDDEHDEGPKPHELYGKFTWKIENFSETSKRELRSNVFDVGGYKWYILVYPQGCDVCNHLSLFLCVADYDKLLPGWSHFAQFTIAVVNKDPKKSKYSDTLHRFCKKEHDWGWKKFMELSKVLDGFTVADTLVIKAQVQVILDKPSRPFRCLDPQYRRELVRVYLTNVEGVCRRFCEDKRLRLMWAKEESTKFKDFWSGLSTDHQRKLLTEKGEAICKGVVKQFFNEKEVTSTLVMDALYSGCKQIEEHSRTSIKSQSADGPLMVLIKSDKNLFSLHGDLMELADTACKDFIPAAKDDNVMVQSNDGLALRSGQEDDYRRDSIERDEKRLAELGRRTVEMYVLSHVFSERLEIGYREAEALKRQDLLIAEEFEQQKSIEIKAKAQSEKDKEKKAKKKERAKVKKDAEQAKKDAEEAERNNTFQASGNTPAMASMHGPPGAQNHARSAASGQHRGQQANSSNKHHPSHAYPTPETNARNDSNSHPGSSKVDQENSASDSNARAAPLPKSTMSAQQNTSSRSQSYAEGPGHNCYMSNPGPSGYAGVGGAAVTSMSSRHSTSSEERDMYGEMMAAGSSGKGPASDISALDQKAGMRQMSGYDAQSTQSQHQMLPNRQHGAHRGPEQQQQRQQQHQHQQHVMGVHDGGAHDSLPLIRTTSSSLPTKQQQQPPQQPQASGPGTYRHQQSLMNPVGMADSNGVPGGKAHLPEAPHSSKAHAAPSNYFSAHLQAGQQDSSSHHGMAGLLHSSSNSSPQIGSEGYGLPSYRNATAGAKAGAAGVGVAGAIPPPPPPPQHGGMLGASSNGLSASHPQLPASPSQGSVPPTQRGDDGGGVGPTTPMRGHLSHTAAEFTGHGLMGVQQQQQQSSAGGLGFGAMQPKHRPPQQPAPMMDSPGLDDFAHMGLIDDLLTE